MMSPQTGWGLTDANIYRTVSGAQKWTRVTPPGVQRNNWLATNFSSMNEAFVASWLPDGSWIHVYHTMDGGKQWSLQVLRLHPAPYGRQLAAEFEHGNGHLLLAVITRTVPGSLKAEAQLQSLFAERTNGTWMKESKDTKTIGAALIRFAPRSSDGAPRVAANGEILFDASFDNGWSWRRESLRISRLLIDRVVNRAVVRFWSGGNGRLVIVTTPKNGRGTTQTQEFITNDGGRRWVQTAPISLGNVGTFAVVDLLNARTQWITGSNAAGTGRYLLRTKDGATTWTRLSMNGIPRAANIIQLDFLNSLEGWALAWLPQHPSPVQILYTTHDGGQQWQRVWSSTHF